MYKKFVAITSILLYFIIIWLAQNSNYFSISTFESLLYMNNSAFGYSSNKAYALFYTVPFLLYTTILFPFEKSYILIRSSREKIYFKFIIKLFLGASIFSFCHMIVNFGLTIFVVEWDILEKTNFFMIGLINMIGLTLFFLWVGILFRLIYDTINSMSIGIVGTFLIIGTLYFVRIEFIPITFWDPFKDLVFYQKLLEESWTMKDVLLSYIREFFLGLTLYLVGSNVVLRKDII